jgi:undecaprenyl-diphosphatase
MDWLQAFILGIVEGLTEYLPVSSTGHLLLAQRALGIPSSEAADAFAICIQAGAIVAVLGLYWQRIARILAGFLGKDPAGLRLGINLLIAFAPAACAGLLLEKPIKKYLFGGESFGLWPIVAAWFVGGCAILAVAIYRNRRAAADRPRADIGGLTWTMAVGIGAAQCLAMWPGTSRSLVTIVAAIIVGLRMASAVEFSFLLGVITLSAATAVDGIKHGAAMFDSYGPLPLAIGFLAAWLSAVLAVKWMVAWLNRHGLEIFGYYRVALAVATAALILFGPLAG